MSKVVLRALDLIGQHLRTHKSGGGADAPLDLAKQVVTQRMDNPAPAAPPVAEKAPKGNTTQGSVFAPKPRVVAPSGLYSHAAEVAGQLPQAKGPAEQMIGMMKNAGVKPAELEHAGMITPEGDVHPDWAGRTVTRDELHKHLTDSMPKVKEKVLGRSGNPPVKFEEYKQLLKDMDNRDLNPEELKKIDAYENWTNVPETKYKKWSLPGGENYRELLLKHKPSNLNSSEKAELEDFHKREPLGQIKSDEVKRFQHLVDKERDLPVPFKSEHWDDPDVLAHLRMSDRTGPNGEKLLHVEELQSDWGQEGREKGFKGKHAELPADRKIIESVNARGEPIFHIEGPNDMTETARHYSRENAINSWLNDRGGVPEAPYVTSTQGWTDLALKRVLKEAAEGGYDGIVFTPGAEQAKRYDLSQQVGRIDAEPANDGKIHLSASSPDMQNVVHRGFYHPDELDSVIGKELADKIRNQIEFPKTIQGHVVKNRKSGLTSDVFEKKEEAEKALNQYPDSIKNNLIVSPVEKKSHGKDVTLSGLDLSFGGEGMKSYYDKMVPSYLQKLVKQHDKDAKLGTLRTNSLPDMLHLPVTDKMRESVLKGQKAFADGGEVEPFKRGGTAKAHPASIIPGVHIVGHNPIFHGDE